MLVCILLFDACLFVDGQILHDMVGWLALLRFGLVTPLGLLILWLLPRTSATWQVDAIAVAGAIVAVLIPMVAATFSQSPHVLIYQFGSMITMTYLILIQRVQCRFAVVGVVAILAIQLWCVALRPEIDTPCYQFVVNFYVSGGVVLTVGSFVLERTERRGFLERLRGEFLIEHIERMARTDPLTGMWNRHHLAIVGEALARANDDANGDVAALMIDIDHFKQFNDTQGHLAGDRCIRLVADNIRQALDQSRDGIPEGCRAFRFGGEEFLLLLPGMDMFQAAVLGEAIRHRLNAARIPHPAMGTGAIVTVSVGVSACRTAAFSLESLVSAADAALYRAKQDGRDRLTMAA